MPGTYSNSGSPTTISWDHTNSDTALNLAVVVVVAVVPLSSSHPASGFTRGCTYDGVDMVSLGVVDCGSGGTYGWVEMFFLADPTTGIDKTVEFTINTGVHSILGESISYSGVAQVTPGSFASFVGTGTSQGVTIPSAPGKVVVAGFACAVAVTGLTGGNNRVEQNVDTTGNAGNSVLADAPGGASVTITASAGSSAIWGAVACSLDAVTNATLDHQTLITGQYNGLTGAGTTTELTVGDVEALIAAHVFTSTTHSTVITQLQRAPTYAIDFAEMDDGDLPASWDTIVGGIPGITVVNGVAVADDGGGAVYTEFSGSQYHSAIVVPGAQGSLGVGSATQLAIGARLDLSGFFNVPICVGVYAIFYDGKAQLVIINSPPTALLVAEIEHTFNPTANYELVCGNTETDDPYWFALLCNNRRVLVYEDSSHDSVLADNTGVGFWIDYDLNPSPSISSFAVIDNAAPVTFGGNVFQDPVLQQDTILTAGSDLLIDDFLEISADTSLEIPADSSLEIYAVTVPPHTSGLYAARPNAGNAGATYYASDKKTAYLDNGASWDQVYAGTEKGDPAAAYVATSETTTSTTYVDLTTTTDQVTVTIGPSGLVQLSWSSYISISGSAGGWVAVDISGANTAAAADSFALEFDAAGAGFAGRFGQSILLTGYTAGSTTFKLKYRVSAGTGTFKERRISAIPL